MAAITVATWADGFGNWRARVTDNIGLPQRAAKAVALAAIRAELTHRLGAYDDRTTGVDLHDWNYDKDTGVRVRVFTEERTR